MCDLSIVYYTANVLREPLFSRAQQQLVTSAGSLPIISVSQAALDLGFNIVMDLSRFYLNIYRQMLAGAKLAETPYVGFAEDDTLYCASHWTAFRPKPDEFAFDMHRWSIYTWTKPAIYSYKDRRSNSTLIAPRELFIAAMTERFARYPEDADVPLQIWGEPGRYEKLLGVTVRKSVQFFAAEPCVTFSHPDAIGYDIQGERKRLGDLRAYDIPSWGRADNLLRNYYGA